MTDEKAILPGKNKSTTPTIKKEINKILKTPYPKGKSIISKGNTFGVYLLKRTKFFKTKTSTNQKIKQYLINLVIGFLLQDRISP